MSTGLHAGVSRVELRAPLGLAMMGYGARRGTSEAVHDPLAVRALYFSEGAPGDRRRAGAGRALLVEADLCLVGVGQAREVRERIAAATGLSCGEVLFGCIHTHSGPETGLADALAGRPEAAAVTALFDTVVEAATAAVERARPARIGCGTAPARIGRNRRVADGPLDPDALVLRVDLVDDPANENGPASAPLAVLYVHGCHPTVLGHDNLAYSADWPGVASRCIESAFPGAIAMFALGPHADVDPRTRGLLDLAIPDQSVGVGFDELERLGRELAEAVVATARAIETDHAGPVRAARATMRLTTHGGSDLDPDGRPRSLARLRADALAALDLAPDSAATTADLYRVGAERTAGLPPEEARARLARVRIYLRDRTAARIAGGPQPDVEVQVMRIGPLWLLGLPLEVTVDVGREWRERAGADGHARVVSIANGWLRYLPHDDHFAEPLAVEKYEILQSTFEPGAARALVDRALALKEALSEG